MSASHVSFNTDELLDIASKKTGLHNYGDPRFRTGLEVLAETFDKNIHIEEKRKAERRQLINWLSTRLRIQDALHKHPEIKQQKIVAPIVVTGLPRTGTSALFNILNSDAQARALLLWETVFPDPLPDFDPRQAGSQPDPRYLAMKQYMQENRDTELDKIHYSHADLPEECVLMQVYSFDGVMRGWEIALQPYSDWFKSHDLEFMYAEHLSHMQLLQWQRPGVRWLIKAPAHMWGLQSLLKVLPDARIVWGHREPSEVIPSICSLQAFMMQRHVGSMDGAEKKRFGASVLDWYADSLKLGLQSRQSLDAASIFDYGFKDFIHDPRAVIENLYAHFDVSISKETKQALEQHLLKNKKGDHGVHKYSMEEYGLTQDKIKRRFEFYSDSPYI